MVFVNQFYDLKINMKTSQKRHGRDTDFKGNTSKKIPKKQTALHCSRNLRGESNVMCKRQSYRIQLQKRKGISKLFVHNHCFER